MRETAIGLQPRDTDVVDAFGGASDIAASACPWRSIIARVT